MMKYEPKDFKLQTTSVWSFPDRGKWATHNSSYRGNWSPFIPRNIILRYSKDKDLILDQFCGSGTTLVEAKLLNRDCIGIDINDKAIAITKKNLLFDFNSSSQIDVCEGNALNLNIDDNSIDLICTHPPYADIIKYSENIKDDLSLLNLEEYFIQMGRVAEESYRVLKKGKICAILIGDTRKNKHIIPIGFNVLNIFLSKGFILKEIIIKEQHNCNSTGFWTKKSIEYNFLLIMHEYFFIFEK